MALRVLPSQAYFISYLEDSHIKIRRGDVKMMMAFPVLVPALIKNTFWHSL